MAWLFKINKKDMVFNIVIITFIFFVRASVMGNYLIPTGSMNPTITEGDRIIANNIAYGIRVPLTESHIMKWGSPERGDIIAFIHPAEKKTNLAKRVIGIPGDRIVINDNNIFINGKPVEKKLVKGNNAIKIYEETLPNGIKYFIQEIRSRTLSFDDRIFVVPEDHLFVMGDNRNNSNDSRYWGFVPVENVLGKLEFCYFSMHPESHKIRLDRIGRVK